VSRGECEELAPLRSAWVDGSLTPAAVDRLMRHLAGCPVCVADVRELCRVRDLLNGIDLRNDAPGSTSAPPAALAERLVRIAGLEAREPLWLRPFRRVRCGSLPSSRRQRRRRLGTAAVATVTFVTAVSVVGYAAAPASALTRLPDPSTATRSEFSATLSELPLGNDALASVLMVRTDVLHSDAAISVEPVSDGVGTVPFRSPAAAGTRSLDEKSALAVLDRAETVGSRLDYSGEEQVQVALPKGSVEALVAIAHRASTGSDVVVSNVAGQPVLTTRVPAPAATRGDGDDDVLQLVAKGFELTGATDGSLLGRRATVIDARDAQGELGARWWVDAETGLLLRQEVYDGSRLQVAAGFTRLQLGSIPTRDHGSAQLALTQTTSTMLLSTATSLVGNGWSCLPELTGLTMIRLRSDSASSPGMLHVVYSDGLRTVSLFERRGELTTAPSGTRWDPALHAYVSTGFPATASWQSGSTVFTVVTDGTPELVASAVTSLPHAPLPRATTMARIRAGWARILHLSSG
jgi:hypothetical protein